MIPAVIINQFEAEVVRNGGGFVEVPMDEILLSGGIDHERAIVESGSLKRVGGAYRLLLSVKIKKGGVPECASEQLNPSFS